MRRFLGRLSRREAIPIALILASSFDIAIHVRDVKLDTAFLLIWGGVGGLLAYEDWKNCRKTKQGSREPVE